MSEVKRKLGFKLTPTDKVIYSSYDPTKGSWQPLVIKKWADRSLYPPPMSVGLNYARSVFEGMKAYRHQDGKIFLFRPEENAKRFANSMRGLFIPPFPKKDFVKAVKMLVKLNAKYAPRYRQGSLYIRPIVWANEGIGFVKQPDTAFTVCFWCSPVGDYYSEGLQPIAVWIARGITRAMPGGLGFCKTSGNYEISLKAQALAKEKGCADALFLDGKTETHIEELGAANTFVVKDNILTTPLLRDTILPGITRKSVITLAGEELHLEVCERDISVEEVIGAHEFFATGTAAVITSIGQIKDRQRLYTIVNGQPGIITRNLYQFLTGIQSGDIPDRFNWLMAVE